MHKITPKGNSLASRRCRARKEQAAFADKRQHGIFASLPVFGADGPLAHNDAKIPKLYAHRYS
jgi:hypothetical protein